MTIGDGNLASGIVIRAMARHNQLISNRFDGDAQHFSADCPAGPGPALRGTEQRASVENYRAGFRYSTVTEADQHARIGDNRPKTRWPASAESGRASRARAGRHLACTA